MYGTKVTLLKKCKGQLLYDYDVYIGPDIRNRHWFLEESEFNNPHQFGKVGSPEHRLELYRTNVLEKGGADMKNKIRNLRGKTLGCICPFVKNHCSGHLLAKLAHGDLPLIKVFDEESLSIDGDKIVLFKGKKCPLSNCYFSIEEPIVMKDDNGFDMSFPFGVRQAHGVLKLKELGWKESAAVLLNAKTISEVNYELNQSSTENLRRRNFHWSVAQSMEAMMKVLKAKYESCVSFRKFCESLGEKIPVEATTSEYWGCAVDLEIFRSLDPRLWPRYMIGQNILGWMIKVVHTLKKEGSILPDFSWVRSCVVDEGLSEQMRVGLRRVCQEFDLTVYGPVNTVEKVIWEEENDPDQPKKRKASTSSEVTDIKRSRKDDDGDDVSKGETDDDASKIGGGGEQHQGEISPTLDASSVDVGMEHDIETDGTPPIA